jgi:hypothetical protein
VPGYVSGRKGSRHRMNPDMMMTSYRGHRQLSDTAYPAISGPMAGPQYMAAIHHTYPYGAL